MQNSKYSVNSLTIDELLSPGTRLFEVPPFQRRYSWGKDEVIQIVDDLFSEATEADFPYFLGSIVLAGKLDEDGHTTLVLDGQQRLTTVSLIITSLIHLLQQEHFEDIAEYKSRILHRASVKDKRREPKLILQRHDAADFSRLVQDPSAAANKEYRHSNIATALICIFDRLKEQSSSLAYHEMLERLLNKVEVVQIIAPSEQDAFRLFETLNDRGLALSAADLIKNKLFSRCAGEIDEALEAWTTMLSSLEGENIVDYLRYYWMAFHGFSRTRGLYKIYHAHIDTMTPDSAGVFALDLAEDSISYFQIANPSDSDVLWGKDIAEVLKRLNSYRARSYRPVLLACSKYLPESMLTTARICEAITVRYSIVGEKNPNSLERIYAEVCSRIRKANMAIADIFDAKILSEIPNDEEFVTKLSQMEIKTKVPAWRTILNALYEHEGTGELFIGGSDRVHIEHILPQNPKSKALKDAGFQSLDEASDFISRLGNLTLLATQMTCLGIFGPVNV